MSPLPIPLREVRVRPVRADEVPRWNETLRQQHYLGFRKLCGCQLKQVAVHGQRWLALLGWQAAALHSGPRDRWIGWSPLQRRTRLFLLANQSRFLLLPRAGSQPGLASRVLGLSLRRLPRDWQQRYATPLLLVETFVDPQRFRGTCYRAANWIELGLTRGFGRVRDAPLSYRRHGRPKTVFVYPLQRDARAQLAGRHPHPAWQQERNRIHLTPKQLESLWNHLRAIPDFRKPRGLRHPLVTVLVIVLAARLKGKKNVTGIWIFGRKLTQKQLARAGARRNPTSGQRVAPSLNTIRRVLAGVDQQQVEAELDAWLQQQAGEVEPGEALALDGKWLRGSYDRDQQPDGELADEPPRQQLAVVGLDTRQVYAQVGFTGKKEDAEAKAGRAALKRIDLSGRVVVFDALHTQRATVEQIIAAGAYYLAPVKQNQPTLCAALEGLDWSRCRSGSMTWLSGGRVQTHTIWVTGDLAGGPQRLPFPGARVAAKLVREAEHKKTGQRRKVQAAYYVTNLRPQNAGPRQLLELARDYWGAVENGMHRVRDGAKLREDACRARKGHQPGVLAACNNLAISILRLLGHKNISRAMEEMSRRQAFCLAVA